MPSIINQAGYTGIVLDFAPDTYSFPIGLVILTAFSAFLLILEAVRYHYSQKTAAGIDTVPTEGEYRQAA